jgi:ParB-like chromosome segregation protein Spo0J
MAGLDQVPAVIIEADDRKVMELGLIENLQREDLNPVEEAKGYQVLMKEYGLTQDEVAQRMGKSRPAIANTLRLLALPEAVISTMAPDKAVAFVWNDKVTEENTREMVEQEWIDTYAKPEIAAMRGDIDDVIPFEELRMRVCSALYMLASKADVSPVRRHPTLAL